MPKPSTPVITDILGNSEPVYDIGSIKSIREVNGERSIGFTVLDTVQNMHAYPLIRSESFIEYKGIEYVIKIYNAKSTGRKSKKTIKALQKYNTDLVDHYVYSFITGVKTLDTCLSFLFVGTDYTYTIIGTFPSQEFDKFGDDNSLSLLQTVLNRFKVEFTIQGTHFTFREKIGNNSDFQFRYKHNIKMLDEAINSHNFSTYIRGFGKDGVEAEYISPLDKELGGPFKRKHAPAFRDEKYTSSASLLARIKREIPDDLPVSLTVDFADMRAAGYPYDVPVEGDSVLLIYEPMGIDIDTRILRVEEEEDSQGNVIKCSVTLSNIRRSPIHRNAALGNTQKILDKMTDEDGKVKLGFLDAAVQRATEDLHSAQTEVEFINGFTLRSKVNPNHLVVLNSAGIGVSTDGGQTFKTALTASGIVADLITVGTMLFDRLKGGTLTLGGPENGNGRMILLDADGEMIVDLDAAQRGFSGNLYVENLISPTVVSYGEADITLYVADRVISGGAEPNDDNLGTSWASPLATINEAFRRIPMRFDGLARIVLNHGGTIYGNIDLRGFIGIGTIEIDGQSKTSTTVVGNILSASNIVNIEFKNFTLNGRSGSFAVISTRQNSYARFSNLNVQGNSSGRGLEALQSGYAEVVDCDFQGVETGMVAKFGTTIYNRDNTGKCSLRGLYAYGGIFMGIGTAPEGEVANEVKHEGGQIFPTFTYPVTTPPAPPPAPETTTEWSTTGTYKGDSWRPQFGGQWLTVGNSEDSVVQGGWDGFGAYKGLWLFGSSPSNAVTGKTIKQIRLYVERKKGGNSGPVNVTFKPHGYTSRPSGEPSYQSPSTQASFSVGTKKWITIPSSFYAGFENGTSKGIGIYINSTNTANYAKFFVDAKLEITYE